MRAGARRGVKPGRPPTGRIRPRRRGPPAGSHLCCAAKSASAPLRRSGGAGRRCAREQCPAGYRFDVTLGSGLRRFSRDGGCSDRRSRRRRIRALDAATVWRHYRGAGPERCGVCGDAAYGIEQSQARSCRGKTDMPALLDNLVLQPAGQPRPIPRSIKREMEIARRGGGNRDEMHAFGRCSALACADCGGLTREIGEDDMLHYRGRAGHACTTDLMGLALDKKLRTRLGERASRPRGTRGSGMQVGEAATAAIGSQPRLEPKEPKNVSGNSASSAARFGALVASAAVPMRPKPRLGLEVKGNYGSNGFTLPAAPKAFIETLPRAPRAALTAE
jgi:hypothetical protein